MTSFLKPFAASNGAMVLSNQRNGRTVATLVTAAFDSESRRTGLLKRTSMPANEALIIAPTNAIHTFFMKFAIDVVFVARDGRVLKVRRALKPWRLAASLRGYAVIEMAAGAVAASDTREGDILALQSAH